MTPFVWSEGHIGWPLFSILVFSGLYLLVTDIAWRLVRVPARSLLICACVIWLVGVACLIAFLWF